MQPSDPSLEGGESEEPGNHRQYCRFEVLLEIELPVPDCCLAGADSTTSCPALLKTLKRVRRLASAQPSSLDWRMRVPLASGSAAAVKSSQDRMMLDRAHRRRCWSECLCCGANV